MELPAFLTASGLLGLFVACALSSLFFLVQPIWAIVDCVDSQREKDAKLLVSLALVFTWGVGSTLYGLFFASSRNLFRFTILTLVVMVLLLIGGVGACTLGVVRSAEEARVEAEAERREVALAVEAFHPPSIALDAVAPFEAIHFVYQAGRPKSAAVAEFTLAGPGLASARDVSERIRHVTATGDALFAVTDHAFGAVSPSTGRLIEIAIDPSLERDFSWPKGIATDAASGALVVMTSHVYTRFFRYDPRTSGWQRLAPEHRDLPLVALAALPAEGLYALERKHGEPALSTLRRFNADGAIVGALQLDPPIPVHPDQDTGFQLRGSSGQLVLIVPPGADAPGAAPRLFVVNPTTGAVSTALPRT